MVKEKLNPARFPGMSGKMAAIVGCIIGEKFTNPSLARITVTSDGHVLGMMYGDIGYNEFIGSAHDLRNNWTNLLDCAGLTEDEFEEAEDLYRQVHATT